MSFKTFCADSTVISGWNRYHILVTLVIFPTIKRDLKVVTAAQNKTRPCINPSHIRKILCRKFSINLEVMFFLISEPVSS